MSLILQYHLNFILGYLVRAQPYHYHWNLKERKLGFRVHFKLINLKVLEPNLLFQIYMKHSFYFYSLELVHFLIFRMDISLTRQKFKNYDYSSYYYWLIQDVWILHLNQSKTFLMHSVFYLSRLHNHNKQKYHHY